MDFQTRPDVCDYMVSLLPEGVATVLEPTPGEGNLVSALRSAGYNVTAPDNFWDMYYDNFDAVVMNPPFTPMSVGYDILERCTRMSDIVITLMPWLTIINSERRTQKLMQFGLRSITHLPRSVFPGARVQTCILNLQHNYCGITEFIAYGVKP